MENRSSYLIHWGQPGRSGKKGAGLYYRNGELTAAGKRHYLEEKRSPGQMGPGKSSSKLNKILSRVDKIKTSSVKKVKGSNKKEKPESDTWKSKDASTLSDAELNRRNSRLQREEQYRRMTDNKDMKKRALKWIGATASTILVAAAIDAAKNKMNKNYTKWMHQYGQKYASKAKNFIASKIKK